VNRNYVKTFLTFDEVSMVLKLKAHRLRCSFCGKKDSEVSKLLGGPKVHICDSCVGVCNKLLEATPSTFSGWDSMTDTELLQSLGPAVATVEATRTVLQTQIDTLRKRGISWNAIGGVLGMSRQAAWERFS
jgi:hypothetical protein